MYRKIEAIAGHPVQPPIDLRIPMALCRYATLRGIGSGREVDQHRKSDLPFLWICGGVSFYYETLANFRTGHVKFLDQTLTQSVALPNGGEASVTLE